MFEVVVCSLKETRMRLLFVVEVRNLEGLFLPKIGFGQIDTLTVWMKKHLSEKMELYAHDWRIVKYVPQDPADNGTRSIN
jgi:hypothetical protein